jgi:hypothetical protein
LASAQIFGAALILKKHIGFWGRLGTYHLYLRIDQKFGFNSESLKKLQKTALKPNPKRKCVSNIFLSLRKLFEHLGGTIQT